MRRPQRALLKTSKTFVAPTSDFRGVPSPFKYGQSPFHGAAYESVQENAGIQPIAVSWLDRCDFDIGGRGPGISFEVPCRASIGGDPGERSFDDAAFGKDPEPSGPAGSRDDLKMIPAALARLVGPWVRRGRCRRRSLRETESEPSVARTAGPHRPCPVCRRSERRPSGEGPGCQSRPPFCRNSRRADLTGGIADDGPRRPGCRDALSTQEEGRCDSIRNR